MGIKRLCITHGVAAILTATPCWAQQSTALPTSEKPHTTLERVFVTLADSEREVSGRLLRLDSQTLTILVENRRIDLPLQRVRRVDKKLDDSVLDGAIVGALFAAACAVWWCNQGADGPSSLPRDAFLGGGVGALVGAGIDARLYRRATIFPVDRPTVSRPTRAGVAVSLRF